MMAGKFKGFGVLVIIAYVAAYFFMNGSFLTWLVGLVFYMPIPLILIGVGELLERIDVHGKMSVSNVPDSILGEAGIKKDGTWKCYSCGRKNGPTIDICGCGKARDEN
jgi:hypothetical protein